MSLIVPTEKPYHDQKGNPSPIKNVGRSFTGGRTIPISNNGGGPFGGGGNGPEGGGPLKGGKSDPLGGGTNDPLGGGGSKEPTY